MATDYTITDGTTQNDVLDMEISESTNEIDECQVLIYGKYSDNIALTISDSTPSPVFVGLQKGVEQNDNYDVTYKLTVQEKAVEMQYVILTGGSGETSFVKTDTASNLVSWVVGQVNTAYGYTGADAWTVDSGSSSSTSLTIGCYYTNALSFLRKVVIDNLGFKLWFDSVNKKVYFRQYFTDRTATPISYITKQEIRDSTKRGCTKVIVIGKNASITGEAGSGNLIRVFSYPTAATTTECTNLATKILADVQYTNVQYTVTLDETAVCNVADYINLDGTNYVVTKKVTTFDKIVITTGALTTSILDTLGTTITEVSGETVTGSDASWSGGNTNVAANAAAATTYVWDIASKSMVSEPYIDVTIGSFIKSADVAANTNYLSAITPLLGSVVYTANENISSGSSNYYPYDGSNRYVSRTGLTDGFQYGLLNFGATVAYNGDSPVQYIRLQPQYSYNGSSWYSITDGSTTFYTDIYLTRRKARVTGSSSFLTSVTLTKTRDSGNRYVASTSGGSPTTYERGIVNDVSIGYDESTVNDTSNDIEYIPVSFTCFIPGSSTNTSIYVRVLITNYTNGTVTIINSSGLLQIIQRHTHPVTTTYDKSTTGTPPSTVNVSVNGNSLGAITPGTPVAISLAYLQDGKNTISVTTPSGSNNQCSVNPTITYKTLGVS